VAASDRGLHEPYDIAKLTARRGLNVIAFKAPIGVADIFAFLLHVSISVGGYFDRVERIRRRGQTSKNQP